MKKIVITAISLIASTSLALEAYFATENGVKHSTGFETPLPNGYVYVGNVNPQLRDKSEKDLTMENGVIREATAEEKSVRNVANCYKSLITPKNATNSAIWREFTAEEKAAYDTQQAQAQSNSMHEAMINWQNSKSDTSKFLENNYVDFLSNTWTAVLQSFSIIQTNQVITVGNTTATQNMGYLLAIKNMGTSSLTNIATRTYLDMSSQFSMFKSLIEKEVEITIGNPPDGSDVMFRAGGNGI